MVQPRSRSEMQLKGNTAETPGVVQMESPQAHVPNDDIARRAYELYERRGGEPGRDWEDWFQAEAEMGMSTPTD